MESIIRRVRAMGDAVTGTLAICVVAFAALGFIGGILNASLYARVAEYYGIARELSTLTTSILFLGLFFISTRKPSLLDRRLLTVVALGCAITAVLVLEFALMLEHGPATVVGFMFSSVASAWAPPCWPARSRLCARPSPRSWAWPSGLRLARWCASRIPRCRTTWAS